MKHRQTAVLVDAGYFFAQASEAVFGFTRARVDLELNEQKSLEMIRAKARAAFPDRDILRIYWYDAPPSRGERMSSSQERMGMMAGVKLRLGALNGAGQQKGVDALLCRDLEELARHQAVDSVLLVSGDEDLRLAMEQAQSHGVKVSLLAMGPGNASIGMALMMESDGMERLERDEISTFLSARSPRAGEPADPRDARPASKPARKSASGKAAGTVQASGTFHGNGQGHGHGHGHGHGNGNGHGHGHGHGNGHGHGHGNGHGHGHGHGHGSGHGSGHGHAVLPSTPRLDPRFDQQGAAGDGPDRADQTLAGSRADQKFEPNAFRNEPRRDVSVEREQGVGKHGSRKKKRGHDSHSQDGQHPEERAPGGPERLAPRLGDRPVVAPLHVYTPIAAEVAAAGPAPAAKRKPRAPRKAAEKATVADPQEKAVKPAPRARAKAATGDKAL